MVACAVLSVSCRDGGSGAAGSLAQAPIRLSGVAGAVTWSYSAVPGKRLGWCYQLRTSGEGSGEESTCLTRPTLGRGRPRLYGDYSVHCGSENVFFLRGDVSDPSWKINAVIGGRSILPQIPRPTAKRSTLFLFAFVTTARKVRLVAKGEGRREVARISADCDLLPGGQEAIEFSSFRGVAARG